MSKERALILGLLLVLVIGSIGFVGAVTCSGNYYSVSNKTCGDFLCLTGCNSDSTDCSLTNYGRSCVPDGGGKYHLTFYTANSRSWNCPDTYGACYCSGGLGYHAHTTYNCVGTDACLQNCHSAGTTQDRCPSYDSICCTSSTWYRDADGDGYGNPASSVSECSQPTGYVANSLDCDDSSAAVHPGATELCNNINDDCDGSIDEGGVCSCTGTVPGGSANKDTNSLAKFGKLNWTYDLTVPYDYCSWRCSANYHVGTGVDANNCFVNTYSCLGTQPVGLGIILGSNNTTILNDSWDYNASTVANVTMCGWKCDASYFRGSGADINKCLPFSCTGSIDGNAVLYVDDNVGLLSNTTNALVDANTSRKCEWYCKSGFYKGTGADVNKCLPLSCQGSVPDGIVGKDLNSTAASGKLNWTFDSAAPYDYCSWRCKVNYHVGTGNDANTCFVNTYSCLGTQPSGPGIILGSSDTTTQNDSWDYNASTIANVTMCGWKCDTGYSRGGGADANKCLPYSCIGAIDGNTIICSDDDTGLFGNVTKTLVDVCTSPVKCEYQCNLAMGFVRSGNTCVRPITPTQSDHNSITSLVVGLSDGNILATLTCTNDKLKADFNIVDSTDAMADANIYTLSGRLLGNTAGGKVDCNIVPTEYILRPLTQLIENGQYRLVAAIPTPCKVCVKEAFLYYKAIPSATSVPDNGIFMVILVLVAVLMVIVSRPRTKKP